MPGGFSLGMELCNAQDVGTNTTASIGTAVPGSASANTKGSWTQLIAATAADTCWVIVSLARITDASWTCAVDIGVGGSGSELVIVNNLVCPYDGGSYPTLHYYSFPLQVPAGTRISARSQGDDGSESVYVAVTTFGGGFIQMEGAAGVDALGFTAASTEGTNLVAGGSANTKGSYAALKTATTSDYLGIFVGCDWFQTNFSNNLIYRYLIDVAIGGAGSEQIIVPNMQAVLTGFTDIDPNCFYNSAFIPIEIPAGSRVSARCQCSTASNNIGLTLYGVYK